jgi:predicted AlkP superfamily phosphohydrolase/phosphomutase
MSQAVGDGGRLIRRPAVVAMAAMLAAVLWFEPSAPPPEPAHFAYVGPGAGFAFLGSFLSLLAAFLVGAASILAWPVRVLWRSLSGKKGWKNAKVRKVIFLGLDGYDPDLAERYMAEGKLPNLSGLRDKGAYSRLRTTYPPLSPVAWSTFATGVNPAKHSLYDFLNRSMKTYLPELSSSRVREPARFLRLGKWRVPLGKASVDMRRKSKTFWSILGDEGIDSSILRVPITFPPEKFNGRMLSAMCTPDLLGTQGSFQQFTTANAGGHFDEAGQQRPLTRNGKGLEGKIEGPPNPLRDDAEVMTAPFKLQINGMGGKLWINGSSHALEPGEYTPWVQLTFHAAPGVKVEGIARFLLTETEPEVSLYVTPINIDPEKPALPISHPTYYATYLAKLQGAYSTLGLAEDTWALNERVIDEQAFLDQAYSICEERETMFKNALDRTKKGIVACVFDTSDRIQHMFFRYLEPDHPAHQKNPHGNGATRYEGVIEDLYQRMDTIVGETLEYVDDDTVFFVLSDHGFKSFRRGVNLNTWLLENGYLALKDGAREAGPYFKGIDWSRTRAYTFGLTGIYLNQKNREADGTVARDEAAALKKEISAKLTGLRDEERGKVAIREAWPKEAVYQGPYMDVAPDIVVGYDLGYRSSWDAALGKVTTEVFQDNLKAWSGDHCVDPALVPGVIFCNRKIGAENPGIEDLAPTALGLFGMKPPPYMDGKDLFTAPKT